MVQSFLKHKTREKNSFTGRARCLLTNLKNFTFVTGFQNNINSLQFFPRNLFLASHQTGSFKVSFFVEKFKSVIQEMLRNVKTFKDLFWLHFDVNFFLQCKILFILKSVLMWLVLSDFSYFLLRLCPSPVRESLLILPWIVFSSP